MRLFEPTPTIAIALLASFYGVSAIQIQTHWEDVIWDDSNWRLTTTALDQGSYQSRMSLANGYLGITVAAVGPFFEVDDSTAGNNTNGWPLFDTRRTFATVAGFYNWQESTEGSNYPWLYQYGGESVISGIPHWSGLVVEADNYTLNASVNSRSIMDFSSTMDYAAGVLSWSYTWVPRHMCSIEVEYSMFVHKLHVNHAVVRLELTALRDVNVTVYDVLDGASAKRTEFVSGAFDRDTPTMWTAVNPVNMSNIVAYVYSTLAGNEAVNVSHRQVVNGTRFSAAEATIAQAVPVSLVAGKTAVVEKYVGVASSDAFDSPQAVARSASLSGAASGYSDLLKSHMEEWEAILTADSVDSFYSPNGSLPADINVQEMHIQAVTNPFYILQNTIGQNAVKASGNNTRLDVNSIPVCGLGSDCYAGFVFWDAEIWMAPGLQMSHPSAMSQIVRYRVDRYRQAQDNVNRAFTSSQNETGKFSHGGAVYPWTSSRHGDCTGTGPCFDYEYHINGDIGISFRNYFIATGDAEHFRENLLPISNSIAWFYAELLTYNETTDEYSLLNATDPDEYVNNIDNPGFTIALIQRHLIETNELNAWFGLPVNDSWTEKVAELPLPVHQEAGIVLEYASQNGSIKVKQADVVLLDDILNYPNPWSRNNLDYYAAKQSTQGPGMTYGVFSIVANEISPSGCASYTYDLQSSQPYARRPWFQYSEQLIDDYDANGGTYPAFPFLTGHGGANRVTIFGYLGLRLFHDRLDIDPSIPPQIPYINYRTFYWMGHAIKARSNTTHTTLTRLNTSLPTANITYFSTPIPVTLGTRSGHFNLSFKNPLILKNRLIGQNTTIKNNILQCLPDISSTNPYLPGQFPLSAIDGASSTKWQPAFVNESAFLTIDLHSSSQKPQYYPIRKILLDWGNTPPNSYTVIFSNTTVPPFLTETGEVDPSIVIVVSEMDVEVSEPWDGERDMGIGLVRGNTTNLTLDSPVWTGSWVCLGIWGSSGGGGVSGDGVGGMVVGGTVAEWSLVVDEGDGGRLW